MFRPTRILVCLGLGAAGVAVAGAAHAAVGASHPAAVASSPTTSTTVKRAVKTPTTTKAPGRTTTATTRPAAAAKTATTVAAKTTSAKTTTTAAKRAAAKGATTTAAKPAVAGTATTVAKVATPFRVQAGAGRTRADAQALRDVAAAADAAGGFFVTGSSPTFRVVSSCRTAADAAAIRALLTKQGVGSFTYRSARC